MSLFNINISKLISDLLPPLKREVNLITLMKGLFSKQDNDNLNLLETIEGTTAPLYTAGMYTIGFRVIYERGVYESLKDGNTDLPTDETSWVKVVNSFLGTNEANNFTTSFIHLEYALNRYFDNIATTPYTLGTGNIYLQNLVLPPLTFLIGYTENKSSSVGYETSKEFISYDESLTTGQEILQINVLTSIATDLGTDYIQIISNFVDKYITAGITYKIELY